MSLLDLRRRPLWPAGAALAGGLVAGFGAAFGAGGEGGEAEKEAKQHGGMDRQNREISECLLMERLVICRMSDR